MDSKAQFGPITIEVVNETGSSPDIRMAIAECPLDTFVWRWPMHSRWPHEGPSYAEMLARALAAVDRTFEVRHLGN